MVDLEERVGALVKLAARLSAKVKEEGEDSEMREQLREYLLNIGIEDPVTRDTHGAGVVRSLHQAAVPFSGPCQPANRLPRLACFLPGGVQLFHRELAKEVARVLPHLMKKVGVQAALRAAKTAGVGTKT
jgi:hypothetical protein